MKLLQSKISCYIDKNKITAVAVIFIFLLSIMVTKQIKTRNLLVDASKNISAIEVDF